MASPKSVPAPFTIGVSDSELEWITDRVKTARLPPPKTFPPGQEWSYGLPHDVATRLQKFWATEYDWRKSEASINKSLKMYTLPIKEGDEDLTIHFVHHPSAHADAIPLLFLHGWPGSFLEVQPIIEELVNPSSSSSQAYHVVAPSLPGFGFSSYPSRPFDLGQMASAMNKVMLALGYERFICQAGDWGSVVARVMALNHPAHCIGVHLNFVVVPPPSIWKAPGSLGKLALKYMTGSWGEYEARMLKRMKWWMDDESGYNKIQGTKPMTIAFPLTDSPFGMLCWIREKVQNLTEEDFVWDDELIVTWSMIYVLNGTAGPAEIYTWATPPRLANLQKYFDNLIGRDVAIGVSVFPQDVGYCPRWWAEGALAENITFWKEHNKGGHFASVEKPKELMEDIREFTAVSGIAKKLKGT